VKLLIYGLSLQNPQRKYRDYCTALEQYGYFGCNEMYVSRVMKQLNLSIKAITYRKIMKYTAANLFRTVRFINWIHTVPWNRLVFIDESRFESSDCMVRRGVAQRGQRLEAIDPTALNPKDESWTVTLACRLEDPPCAVPWMHQGTNGAFDFGTAVLRLIEAGFIRAGDFLIADNARIHTCPDMLDPLNDVLATLGATLVLQPAYSPEYNACEMIFGKGKLFLRGHRNPQSPFSTEIMRAFAHVTLFDVFGFFSHCIYA